ncbi:head-tail adaptor protein [Clostridium sp. AF15-6B]|jgi:hypothetical protein|nr:head-tail adaptor protein [Clostridium sp. AF16-25]RGH02850.1 head-tail adaptor protein [Clostridium sp. AF15-49]RGH07579.1 head-tail adaptor protein [Clostridium sp. AF15-6B]
MDDEIILIETKTDQDDIGNTIITETIEHPVICKVQPVDRQEFFKAGQVGMNPKYRFDTDKVNYHGEELVKYKDKVYGIYRTYEAGTDTIELYAEEKAGVTYVEQDD